MYVYTHIDVYMCTCMYLCVKSVRRDKNQKWKTLTASSDSPERAYLNALTIKVDCKPHCKMLIKLEQSSLQYSTIV